MPKSPTILTWCSLCKERSAVIKCYTSRVDNKRIRVEYCINKGCGYKKDLPFYVLEESKC